MKFRIILFCLFLLTIPKLIVGYIQNENHYVKIEREKEFVTIKEVTENVYPKPPILLSNTQIIKAIKRGKKVQKKHEIYKLLKWFPIPLIQVFEITEVCTWSGQKWRVIKNEKFLSQKQSFVDAVYYYIPLIAPIIILLAVYVWNRFKFKRSHFCITLPLALMHTPFLFAVLIVLYKENIHLFVQYLFTLLGVWWCFFIWFLFIKKQHIDYV